MVSLLSTLSLDDKLNMLQAAKGPIVVDTEGVPMVGLSVAFEGPPDGFYFGIDHAGDHNLSDLQRARLFYILDNAEALIFHNALHDLKVLADFGFHYLGKFYDTMLMAHWVNEERFNYGLDAISVIYGGKPKNKPKLMQDLIDQDGWNMIPFNMMDEYSSNDAYITFQAFIPIYEDFVSQGFDTEELWGVEQAFIREVLIPMKARGIRVDMEFCIKEYMRGAGIMEACTRELGFNPGSTLQLKKFLIDDLGLPILSYTPKGRPQFTKKEMSRYETMLEHKKDVRATTILRYRGWQKTNSSNYKAYLNLVDEDGILHPNYNLHRTVTSRLSCDNPNLQQIPKSTDKDWNGELKKAFIPRVGFGLWGIDYSQLQFRMAVSYANQEDLIDIFNDRTRDIFQEMAGQLGWLRNSVKTLVYLTLFGGGAERAKEAFGLDSLEDAKVLVNEFHSEYPNIKKTANMAQRAAQRLGFTQFWTGRRRHFKKSRANPKPPYFRAFNAAIQGGEAEIVKRALIELQRTVCDENCFILLQIHDEVVFEIREGMEEYYLKRAQEVMERVPQQFCNFTGNHVEFHTSAGKWGEK